MRNNNTPKFARRRVLATSSTALFSGFIGTASARQEEKTGVTSDHKIPYDVSITNNGNKNRD